jgi:class 3 adenylate cyclase
MLREPAVKGQAMLPLMMFFGMSVLTILYGFVGVGFSSLGGYLRFRREEAVLRRRSRQELLQRLFEIEEALRRPEIPLEEPRLPWLNGIRRNIFLWAGGVGAALGLLVSVSMLFFPAPPEGSQPTDAYTGFFLSQLVLSVVTILMQMGMSFLGGGPVRSILVSLVFGYASTLVAFIPIGSSASRVMSEHMLGNFIAGTLMAVVFGLFAGLGASVEQRALQARRRQANDPQVLLSEFVEIQRLLNPMSKSKCVMVVDAAKSSTMKANADPLIAEWSFRAYQEFIAEHVRSCGGAIYSTAGDGAMASFDSASCAFECARTIQTKIADFNAYVNKLKDPFRLRIGIHCGEVSGELDEVEFTAVLDIAAHVEAASQVGGIAVTASVKDQLPDQRFAEIQDVIDEQRVFLALNPTLDPE